MTLDATHQLLLAIRDREPYIGRVDPADGRAVLFFPASPVRAPGHIRAWLLGEGGMEVDWTYFANTARPQTDEEKLQVGTVVDFHYAMYPERKGLALDRDYSALRERREGR